MSYPPQLWPLWSLIHLIWALKLGTSWQAMASQSLLHFVSHYAVVPGNQKSKNSLLNCGLVNPGEHPKQLPQIPEFLVKTVLPTVFSKTLGTIPPAKLPTVNDIKHCSMVVWVFHGTWWLMRVWMKLVKIIQAHMTSTVFWKPLGTIPPAIPPTINDIKNYAMVAWIFHVTWWLMSVSFMLVKFNPGPHEN